MIPFMVDGLVFVPKALSLLILAGLVIAGIVELRHGAWIGRPALAANAFFLWQIFFPFWVTLPGIVQIYLNIGTIIAAIALGSYFLGRSLPSEFYQITFLGYGSISVIFAIFYVTTLGIPIL